VLGSQLAFRSVSTSGIASAVIGTLVAYIHHRLYVVQNQSEPIKYLNSSLNYRIPLRPHLGIMGENRPVDPSSKTSMIGNLVPTD
jgi:hypothetical protein